MRRQNKAIHPDKNKKKQTADNRLRPWAVAVWLAVWELASLYIGQEILLVSPVSVLRRLTVLAVQSDFWGSIAFSFFRIIGGFLLASLCGTLLASLSAAFRFVRDLLAPAMAAIKAVPVASFIILVLIWVPSRNLSVVISFLMVLPVIYTNVLGGILSTEAAGNGTGFPYSAVPPHPLHLSLPAPPLSADRLFPLSGTMLESRRCRRGHRHPQRLHRRKAIRSQSIPGNPRPLFLDAGHRTNQRHL